MFGSSSNNSNKTGTALPKVAVDNFEVYIGKTTQMTGTLKATLWLAKPASLKPIFLALT